jgi:hypothetical protein
MAWQGRHFLNELAPFSASCANPVAVEAAINAAAIIGVLSIRVFPSTRVWGQGM